ncbi:MAG: DUF4382 domain-containing protein [Candidatus Bathyarchaeia archaeon]
MATKNQALKYGFAAVLVALAIIGTSLYTNTLLNPAGQSTQVGQTNFLVMLTDPPTVPKGTTQLNVTYSSIQVHVVSSGGLSNWVAAQESGRVNLLKLVNVTQTIASVSLPTGSTVDKLQFKLSSAEANVSGVVYPVTLLSDQLLINIKSKLNGTNTAALIDLRPTLLEINATNSTGGSVKYFVLSPSATAVIQGIVDETQSKIGCRTNLNDKEGRDLDKAYKSASNNVTISQPTLSVRGNVTTFSVTLKNVGKANATLMSLTLQGDFNSTFSWFVKEQSMKGKGGMGRGTMPGGLMMKDHPEAIPFRISGDKLVPFFGEDLRDSGANGKLVLKPGESVTLTYSGVLQLRSDGWGKSPSVVVKPVVGKSYTLHVMSNGSETSTVTATTG